MEIENSAPRVLNARVTGTNVPGAIYVGRPSPWGNPIPLSKTKDRDQVLSEYLDWLQANPDFVDRVRTELAGKDLICWCAPKACHADILRDLALGKPLPPRITQKQQAGERIYDRKEVAGFCKTREAFGAFSNMHPGFPLAWNGINIGSSEAWYQALRYPDLPDVQEAILRTENPMAAKKLAHTSIEKTRPDWEVVRITAMRHGIRFKAATHRDIFEDLMREAGDRPIVEISTRDAFWGAKPQADGTLRGANILGRLLMELRLEMQGWAPDREVAVSVPGGGRLKMLGKDIGRLTVAKILPDQISLLL